MDPVESPSRFDPEEVRTRDAWFSAGVNAVLKIVFITTLLMGSVWAFVVGVFDVEAQDAVATFAAFQLLLFAGVGMYLGFRSRSIARSEQVQIDRL